MRSFTAVISLCMIIGHLPSSGVAATASVPPLNSPHSLSTTPNLDIRNWCTSTIPDLPQNFLSWDEKARERVARLENMATHNNPEAQAELGCLLQFGLLGQAGDSVKALQLYTASAAQNHPLGQAFLAGVFEFGLFGQAKNSVKALKLYTASAAQNNPLGQALLGVAFEQGLFGQAKNQAKALQLYTSSAAQNNPSGYFMLGRVFEFGLFGQAKDPAKALELYTASAAQNHPFGQGCLGSVFERGLLGQAVDTVKALELYKKASEGGCDHAKALYERLKNRAYLNQPITILPNISCSICLAKLGGTNQLMAITPCGHGFHPACLTNWNTAQPNPGEPMCPNCRRTFTR